MQETNPDAALKDFRDRGTLLVTLGVVEVVLGALCALFVPLMFVQLLIPPQMRPPGTLQPRAGAMMGAAAFYAVFAAALVAIGVGSLRKRRWARAIMLAASGLALVVGFLSLVMFAVISPRMWRGMQEAMRDASGPGAPDMPPGLVAAIQVATTLVMAVFYVVVPATFFLLYRMRGVRETCEYHNPSPSWTDRIPLPVLALGISLGFTAAWSAFMPLAAPVFPLFGMLLKGAPCALGWLASAAALWWAARSVCRLDPAGWWGALSLAGLLALSGTLTSARVPMSEVYEAMGYSPDELRVLMRFNPWEGGVLAGFVGACGALWLVFILFCRRYFAAGASSGRVEGNPTGKENP